MNWDMMSTIVTLGLQISAAVFYAVLFIVIKFNDLKHIETLLLEVKVDIKDNTRHISALAERIASLEGQRKV